MTPLNPRNLAVGFLLLSMMLAGCLGGDDPQTDDLNGENSEPEEGLGSVRGTIVTTHLQPIENARINLVQESEMIAEGKTDAEGLYRINNVEPGDYRVQITAPCCREHVQGVSVLPDDVVDVNVQLEPFSSDDLQIGRVEQLDWVGFLACTVAAADAGLNTCGAVDLVFEIGGQDPPTDDDFLHVWEVQKGLQTVVGAMTWDSPGAALGDELWLLMEVNGRWNENPRYVNQGGTSPIEFRVETGDVIAGHGESLHKYDFENVEDEPLEVAYRIFGSGAVNVIYQQQFTIYWDLYYWDAAPEDATALPDF